MYPDNGMKTIGSQTRSTLLEEGLTVHNRLNDTNVILADENGSFALYVANNDYSGHVVEIDGIGYEFVTSRVDGEGDPLS
jgi:hypothetical protein